MDWELCSQHLTGGYYFGDEIYVPKRRYAGSCIQTGWPDPLDV